MGPPPYDRFQLFCTTEITISAWTKQTTYEDGSLGQARRIEKAFLCAGDNIQVSASSFHHIFRELKT
jgi:hypothetical protein